MKNTTETASNSQNCKNSYIRTYLACESGVLSPDFFKGATYEAEEKEGVKIERMTVLDSTGEAETGKEKGCYITVSSPLLKNHFLFDFSPAKIISKELDSLLKKATGIADIKKATVLVCALGNRFITCDALGPLCADKITPTRHMASSSPLFVSVECSNVSVFHPGVLGQTGMESALVIKGIAEKIKPDAIIAIDALAARSTDRLFSTVQLSNTGISPGSGIGNRRLSINEKSLGFPVISIGVPTVVNSATLICDALEKSGETKISPALEKILQNEKSFFVSPRDCDLAVEHLSKIISQAVNTSLGTEDF